MARDLSYVSEQDEHSITSVLLNSNSVPVSKMDVWDKRLRARDRYVFQYSTIWQPELEQSL